MITEMKVVHFLQMMVVEKYGHLIVKMFYDQKKKEEELWS